MTARLFVWNIRPKVRLDFFTLVHKVPHPFPCHKNFKMSCTLKLQNGPFPNMWKIARVTPIFKSGQRTEVNNCRPIAILFVFPRLPEKVVHDQMYGFVKEHKIMSANKFAFQKMHDTVSSLIDATESCYENNDNRKLDISVFLDLRKAFDTFNLSILLSKLAVCGIVGVPRNWFATYLAGREQILLSGWSKF